VEHPLEIRANMSWKKSVFEVQQQIILALKDFCGAPTLERKIQISEFNGEICFYWQYYLSKEVGAIRKALEECDGIEAQTLRIIQTTEVCH
jgi:hypothetical protein